MTLESYFQVPQNVRNRFIREEVLKRLPEEGTNFANKVYEIVDGFVGADIDTLLVLSYAAERDRTRSGAFRNTLGLLEGLYSRFVSEVPHDQRRMIDDMKSGPESKPTHPLMAQAKKVFDALYAELGVRYDHTGIGIGLNPV